MFKVWNLVNGKKKHSHAIFTIDQSLTCTKNYQFVSFYETEYPSVVFLKSVSILYPTTLELQGIMASRRLSVCPFVHLTCPSVRIFI